MPSSIHAASLAMAASGFSTTSASPTITLTAYSMDGTNSGTGRLGRRVTIDASIGGQPDATFTWSLQGAGTLTSTGTLTSSGVYYTAPAYMPSYETVKVTATLTTDPTVSATYQMALIYAVPTIRWLQPSALVAGKTNAVTVVGYDLTPASTVLVGGAVVPSVFQAPNTMVAQIAVPSTGVNSLSLVARNPTPGGGNSAPSLATVKSSTTSSTSPITITTYSADGTNSGIARLGRNVTLVAGIQGQSTATFAWSVQGSGTITSSGVYTAPAYMPSSSTVTVTATLTSDPTVSAKCQMTFEYEVPTIRWIQPTQLLTGKMNAVSVVGYDFTPATTILVGGAVVTSTFQAPNTVIAQIPVGNVAMNSLSVVAHNPTPGGGNSAATVATIKPLTIQLTSYNETGINPTSVPLGLDVQFLATVQGSGNPALTWGFNWSVQGGGTISSAGLYHAPSTMPAGATAIVTAALAADSSISTSYKISLLNPVPAINESEPMEAAIGQTNVITFFGHGFAPSTTILVNGSPVATTYSSPSSVVASIPVSSGATGPLSITAQNPTPGGGAGSAFSLMIANSASASATIGTTAGRSIAGNFLGFSHEWGDAQPYMGSSLIGVNNIYRQLLQNLINPGSTFSIRIGGGSTDNSGEPTSTTALAFSDLAKAMPVHFSLGVNLGADNVQLAEDQASAYVAQMPAGSIDSIEIGNEPDLYAQTGRRASTYNFTNYLSDFDTWRAGIRPLLPSSVKLMGSSWSSVWYMEQNLTSLEQTEAANLSTSTQHFYAGYQESTQSFPYDYLLKPSVSTQYVPALASAAATAHTYGQLFRVNEMNSIDDGGKFGISNSFSSALWAIDTMFELANAGVDGVNWHGMSGCEYCAFTFGIKNMNGQNLYTLRQVNPLYYGFLFFHAATANSARLLPVTLSSQPNVKVWATVDQTGTAHVAILNKDEAFAGTVSITLPGYGQATAVRLVAPNYQSTVGISFGGQTFDGSMDGNLLGTATNEQIDPTSSVYSVTVQPTSAVLLTLAPQ